MRSMELQAALEIAELRGPDAAFGLLLAERDDLRDENTALRHVAIAARVVVATAGIDDVQRLTAWAALVVALSDLDSFERDVL